VQYELLPKVLKQEGSDFYNTDKKWQPKDLIPDPYRRNLLKDAQGRFKDISQAEREFRTLERAPMYVQILRRMRLTIKDAQFAWRTDDLKFLAAIASFFSDYGTMLRFLKYDEARGRLKNQEPPSGD
jgi:hypothetical protein